VLYIEGRDHRVAVGGAAAKQTTQMINREHIYSPRSRTAAEILRGSAGGAGHAAAFHSK
jgi:hypothetical protein